jgi:hypothetical protein
MVRNSQEGVQQTVGQHGGGDRQRQGKYGDSECAHDSPILLS